MVLGPCWFFSLSQQARSDTDTLDNQTVRHALAKASGTLPLESNLFDVLLRLGAKMSIDDEWSEGDERRDQNHTEFDHRPFVRPGRPQGGEHEEDEQEAVDGAEDLNRQRLLGQVLERHGDQEQDQEGNPFGNTDSP